MSVTALTGSGSTTRPGARVSAPGRYHTTAAARRHRTLGEEDQATFEAISAGRTFEDIKASMTQRLPQKTMLKAGVIFGNARWRWYASAPTLSAGGTGSCRDR